MTTMPLMSYPTIIGCVNECVITDKELKNLHSVESMTDLKDICTYLEKFNQDDQIEFFKVNDSQDEYDGVYYWSIEIDMGRIKDFRNSVNKYQEMSVLILNDASVQVSHFSDLDCIKAHGVKIILLAEEMSNEAAIAALNFGKIDYFIRHGVSDWQKNLLNAIQNLTQEYFMQKTKFLSQYLSIGELSKLSDPQYIMHFKLWCTKNHIQEYALLNAAGDFVAKDQEGKEYYFATHTEKTIADFLDVYQNNEEVKDFTQEIKNKNMLPFIHDNDKPWEMDALKWRVNFHTPKVLNGRETYYCAVVQA